MKTRYPPTPMKSAFMRHRFSSLALILVLLAPGVGFSQAVLPPDLSKAVAWYDTLGYPDVGKLPYIRFRNGSGTEVGNGPFQWSNEEGFLVREDPNSFTVFVCELTDFETENFMSVFTEPYLSLTTVRILKDNHHRYDVVDFKKAADDGLASMRKQVSRPFPEYHLQWGVIVSNRLRIFALGRACLQKGLPDTGLALMNIAANIPDEQTDKIDPATFVDHLQHDLGNAVITEADSACGDLSKSWSDILKYYENFAALYPASDKIALARESADLLKKMIAAWRAVQPRLATNQDDAYGQAGGVITFLAGSGSTAAIEALQKEMPKAPVDVRLAIVKVFLPFGNGGESATGAIVTADSGDMPDKLPAATLPSIERLLLSALKDTGRRTGMDGSFNGANYKDPRICDMAALVLSTRWPEKYRFLWTANAADCDGQIAKMLTQGRSGSG